MAMRRMYLFFFLLISLLATAFAGTARAGDEWPPIDPAELKMTREPLAPGAPAIILYRQVDRADKVMNPTDYNYQRIKILTEEGRKYANIEIPFEKKLFRVNAIRARTIHPDGSIVNFEGKIYENTIVKSQTEKYLAKTFTMPDVTVGSVIEYSFNYAYQQFMLVESRWILSEELFTKDAKFTLRPFREFAWRVVWSWPAGVPNEATPVTEDEQHILHMEAKNLPAFQTEEYMPPANEFRFWVRFIYTKDVPEMNEDKYWASFGKKENGRAEEFVNKRKALEQAEAQIVSPNDAPMLKLEKIYTRMQQIRNLDLEEHKMEEEQKRENLKSATNAEEVWKSQYGKAEDISWLFLGLVRAAGIEAYPCKVSRRNQYFFHRDRLNSNDLKASVVLVKLDGKEMYFDPGAAFAPFGLLPWEESGVPGLKLDKEGGRWITTSLPDSDATRIERKSDLKLQEDGSLEGKVTVTWTGLEATWRRAEQRNQDETSRKKYLEDDLKDSIAMGSQVDLTSPPDWKNSDTPLTGEFTVKVPGYVTSAGRKMLLPMSLFSAEELHMFEHAQRVYDIYFKYPAKKIDDITIDLPLDWKSTTLPKPFDKNAKAADYKLSVEDQKGAVHIRRELRMDLTLVPKESYPALRGFFQVVRAQDDQQIVLLPGGVSATR